ALILYPRKRGETEEKRTPTLPSCFLPSPARRGGEGWGHTPQGAGWGQGGNRSDQSNTRDANLPMAPGKRRRHREHEARFTAQHISRRAIEDFEIAPVDPFQRKVERAFRVAHSDRIIEILAVRLVPVIAAAVTHVGQ